jgi:carnosine N-methyltransferase
MEQPPQQFSQLQEEYDFNRDDEEKQHWWQVMRTFLYYGDFCEYDLKRRERHLNQLPEQYKKKLPDVTLNKFHDLRIAVDNNLKFLEDMVCFHASSGFPEPPNFILEYLKMEDTDKEMYSFPHKEIGPPVDARQQHRTQAVIHSIYREWSQEGAEERNQAFLPLLQELQRLKPIQKKDYSLKVLVPGCGLGRLPLEVAALGYHCEGNEYSS